MSDCSEISEALIEFMMFLLTASETRNVQQRLGRDCKLHYVHIDFSVHNNAFDVNDDVVTSLYRPIVYDFKATLYTH